ncbi:MAG: class II aldolase/adducin family protein [Calditrichae bacterium]|nr:class II aldolase/adducin family protein [Calditrichota bacterium]MCB9059063.1 class II aldolase/adducin family protein [Calditrichia bacterium]
MQTEWSVKRDIVEVGKRLWQRQFVAANDGNISVKLDEKFLLATPTGVSKGFMNAEMLVRTDMNGQPISKNPKFKPSSEILMHLEVYKNRPEINAVVHAHPVYCTAFAVAGIPLDKCILPEAIVTLGIVPIAPFGLPSTNEIPESIRPFLKTSDAILLQNHGALTFGKDLFEAYYRMETLEHSASIIWHAQQLGTPNILSEKDRDRLQHLRQKYGIEASASPCKPSEDEPTTNKSKSDISDEKIREITRNIKSRLK